MGADGGSIPKRCELVKSAKTPEKPDPTVIKIAKWTTCSLSKERLAKPIVACRKGLMYNRESVVQFLLDRESFPLSSPSSFHHIRSLRDVCTLNLSGGMAHTHVAECPLTKRPMNGNSRFVFVFGCGCVLSESLLKEVGDGCCPVCSASIGSPRDIIALNSASSELAAAGGTKRHTLKKRPLEPCIAFPASSPISELHRVVSERLVSQKDIGSISSIYNRPNDK